MDDKRQYMHVIDYVIFGLTLFLSSVIGIYFAYKHRKQQTTEGYLLANRSVHWIPLFISMVASFFSALGVLGVPAQIYTTGVTFFLYAISFFLVCSFSAEVFVPLYRKLELVSVNEYLEQRYGGYCMMIGYVLVMLQLLLNLSVALYAPALALNSAAGVPITATVLSTGVIVTFYTVLGGMRAVIWTDVFQSAIMLIGLLIVVAMGVHRVGSLSQIFKIAEEWNRLEISFDADPSTFHTFWGMLIGLTINLSSMWTTSQVTMQRIVAAQSSKHAKIALYASSLLIIVIFTILVLAAYAMFATYFNCDLVKSKKIFSYDQVLPYFIVTELGSVKGIPGLFTACIFSFTLSTVSSGLNAISALCLKDILVKWKPNLSTKHQFLFMKLIAVLGGAVITGFTFVIPKIGKFILKLAIQVNGIAGAPIFAMFIMGHFSDKTNKLGVYIGVPSGFAVGWMFAIGQIFYPPDRQLPPISVKGCSFYNASNDPMGGKIYLKAPRHNNAFASLVSVSYAWHGAINFTLVCLIIYVVGLFTSTQAERTLIKKELIYDYKNNRLYKLYRKFKDRNSKAKDVYSKDNESAQCDTEI